MDFYLSLNQLTLVMSWSWGFGGVGLTDGLIEEEGLADVFDFGDCAF
jgi:hypothetical protein